MSNQSGEARQPVRARSGWAGWLETAGVALSQPAVALVLRLTAPRGLPDPAVHTAYVIAPRDMFTRYAAAFATTARLGEGPRRAPCRSASGLADRRTPPVAEQLALRGLKAERLWAGAGLGQAASQRGQAHPYGRGGLPGAEVQEESERGRFPLAGWQPAQSQGHGRAFGPRCLVRSAGAAGGPAPAPGPPAAVLEMVMPGQP